MYVVRVCPRCRKPGKVISSSHVVGIPDVALGWFVMPAGEVLDEVELIKHGLARADSVMVRHATCTSCRMAGASVSGQVSFFSSSLETR
jgi:hypothetical protein